MTLLLVLIALLTSELPKPGQPTLPNLCGGFAGFVGMAIGVQRGREWEKTAKLATVSGAFGYGTGLAVRLTLVAIDRL